MVSLSFFLAGRRPADAGLLDVLGAPMYGPGLHPGAGCFAAAASASPARIGISQKRCGSKKPHPLPGHLRIGLMAD
jgi:hypothetical protein